MTTAAIVFFLILEFLIALWLVGQFIWERGYNAAQKDRDEYDKRREFGPVSNQDLAMKFLQSRKPSEPPWSKEDIIKVYKGIMKYDEDKEK